MEILETPPSPEEPAPTGCLFCQGDLAQMRTREHVIPRWLLERFDLAHEIVAPVHASSKFEQISGRLHRLDALVEGRICASCNHGWMSDLEDTSRPYLEPLVAGAGDLASLDFDGRRLAARWATKTAYMLNWSANYPRKVPLSHLAALRAGDALPPGVVVLACRYAGEAPVSWLQVPAWFADPRSKEEFLALGSCSYKITLQIGRLLLLVAYWPDPTWTYEFETETHRNLWPPRMRFILGSAHERPDETDPMFPIYWFHLMLGIADPEHVAQILRKSDDA